MHQHIESMCAATGPALGMYDSDEFSEESDVDYIDSDASEEEGLWLGHNDPQRQLDRCRYIHLHKPVLDELFYSLQLTGRSALGDAFLQECSKERFYNFCYCNTTRP